MADNSPFTGGQGLPLEPTVNPNATPGAGRGVPIKASMSDFMGKVASRQADRNGQLASIKTRSQGGEPSHRSIILPHANLLANAKKAFGHRVHREFNPNSGPPFSLLSMETSETGATVTVNPGYVVEWVTSGAATSGLLLHEVTFDSTSLFADPPPEIEMNYGQSLYVKYETDDHGGITGDKVLIVDDSDSKQSTHYQPGDGEGAPGTNGVMYVRIGKLSGTGADDAKWVQGQNSDIEHFHELWTGNNIGTGASLFKGRNPDSDNYEFHRAEAGWGTQIEANGDSVKWDFLGTNVGGGSEVLVDTEEGGEDTPTSGAVGFRTIRGLNTSEETAGLSKQINVDVADGETGTDNTIRIKGNGVVGSNAYVTVVDGLVTDVGDGSGGSGFTGDFAIRDCDGDPFATPPVNATLRAVLKFTDGRCTDIKDYPLETDLGETVKTVYLQSCHWVDDVEHTHA